MVSAYTETTRNGDFTPKSEIISKNTDKKNIILYILTNIKTDGLTQKNISRY